MKKVIVIFLNGDDAETGGELLEVVKLVTDKDIAIIPISTNSDCAHQNWQKQDFCPTRQLFNQITNDLLNDWMDGTKSMK